MKVAHQGVRSIRGASAVEERRKLERMYLAFFSRVFDRQDGRMLGYLSDLTTGGALMIAEKPQELRKELQLRMDLPAEFPQQSLDINAKVIWCQPDEHSNGLYRIGLHFQRISPEEISLLAQLLAKYGFR